MRGDIVGNDGRRHFEIFIEPGLYEKKVKEEEKNMMEGDFNYIHIYI